MNKHSKHLLLYVVLLVLSHGVWVITSNLDFLGYGTLLHRLIVLCLLIIVPLVISLKIQSWRQFVVYLLVTIIVWQLSSIFDDWMTGRLSDPFWLKDKEGTWSFEILRRSIVPTIVLGVGALWGQSKRTPRLH